ncbi:O-methyltransferase [Pseudodonghicola xiamenensis]|uniref:Uncharacterized protein n=1 Tax=Pseudodonghicola xiamenensis TaxID=337702 RepID=A0A8J3MCD9_9RHOB|nr:class I SAM-dependent methyltransferase [Pseudodonghicola xiamenensis]GHG83750.1 hypothetical protein GCM10010961_09390 [Pseudodonghicola xiamenensis]
MRIPDYPAGEAGQWAAVDRYFSDPLASSDPALEQTLAENARAGLSDRVDLGEGPALEVLPSLDGLFDLVFIDADKPNTPGIWSRPCG